MNSIMDDLRGVCFSPRRFFHNLEYSALTSYAYFDIFFIQFNDKISQFIDVIFGDVYLGEMFLKGNNAMKKLLNKNSDSP